MISLNRVKQLTDMQDNRIAFIGLDAQLDGMSSIDHLQASCYQGEKTISSDFKVDLDFSALCKISANKVLKANRLTPSQVVVIVVDSELQNNGAPHSDATWQAFDRYQKVANLGEALSISACIIRKEEVAVLIIAANVKNQLTYEPQASMSFSENFCDYSSLNGVCCLLLSSESFASTYNSTVYAYLKNHQCSGNQSALMTSAIAQSFVNSGINSQMISAIEVSALAQPEQKSLEEEVLLASYNNGLTLNSSLSCVKSVTGDNGSLSELLGLLNLIFTLYLRYRCPVKGWNRPIQAQLEKWENAPFYITAQASPIFPNKDKSARYASYSCLSEKRFCHLILEENNDGLSHDNGFIRSLDLKLFIVAEDSQQALLKRLNSLLNETDYEGLATQLYTIFSQQQKKKHCLVLMASSLAELKTELGQAVVGVEQAFVNNSVWRTPKGSYFTTLNVAETDKITFLYPGIGATYIGLGRELFHLFPELYPKISSLAEDLAVTLKDLRLNPRTIEALNFKELKERELALRHDLADIAEAGVAFACVFTQLFDSVFNIKADLAAGYSMGEVSMFAAQGCWQSPGLMSARLAQFDTFNRRLSGELQVVRELWNLPQSEQSVWETYSIKATRAQVEAVLKETDRVYITIINSADNLLIAGYPKDCLVVIKRLGLRAMPLNIANAIHCAPAYAEYEKMQTLYEMDLNASISSKLYSSSCYLPIPLHKKAIAVSISQCLCQQVDFPRLINKLFAQGGRVFIEMGAGTSLSNWTDKILNAQTKTDNHLSVPINVKGSNELQTYFKTCAKLLSAGVNINLARFFYGSIILPVDKTKQKI